MKPRVLLFLFGSRALGGLASLGASIILSRALGPSGRGEVAALLAFLWTIRICVAGGMQQAVALGSRSQEGGLLLVSLGLAAVGGAAGLGIGTVFDLDGGGGSVVVRIVVGVCLPLVVLTEWCLGVVVGRDMHLANAAVRAFPEVSRLFVFGILGLLGFLTIQTAASATAVALALPTVVALFWWYRSRSETYEIAGLERLRDAHPGAVARLLTRRVDQLLLGILVGPTELGLYATAVAVSEAPFVAVQGIQSYVARSASREDTGSNARLVRAILAVGALVGVAGAATSWILIVPVFGTAFEAARLPAVILFLSTPFLLVGSAGGAALAGAGGARKESRVQMLGLITNLLALVLLYRFGATGAAIASSVAYMIVAALVGRELRGYAEQSHSPSSVP